MRKNSGYKLCAFLITPEQLSEGQKIAAANDYTFAAWLRHLIHREITQAEKCKTKE
jgi:hypothetical protein